MCRDYWTFSGICREDTGAAVLDAMKQSCFSKFERFDIALTRVIQENAYISTLFNNDRSVAVVFHLSFNKFWDVWETVGVKFIALPLVFLIN